ncbi:MAG TPA: aminopeptidase P family N-terminal domain-containing protein, partial [Burkholderiaceae bacterium]|nr:aminopeptidase P family N-terminal domain-containing protein [Burkholderiaceae bacterium]
MDTLAASRAIVRQRIEALRAALLTQGLDAWLQPSADPHVSEYLPERWQGRQWLSGFTGSVGLLIVTAEFAGLWVDSRYWVQAETQLAGTGIDVMKVGSAGSAAYMDWLAEHVATGGAVGVDGAVLGLAQAQALQEKLESRDIRLVTDRDLLGHVWTERPPLPAAAVFEHAPPFALVPRREKLATVHDAMRRHGADWHLVCTLDDIAWITNLRGADVPYNPVFVAHLLVGMQSATLFVA